MFITQYGNHLGDARWYFVTATPEVTELNIEQVRHHILKDSYPFLHQSLITDEERSEIEYYRKWRS